MTSALPAPRVLLVMTDQWPRALLRAALRECGYDAVGTRSVAGAARLAAPDEGRGPVGLVVLEQETLTGGTREPGPAAVGARRPDRAPRSGDPPGGSRTLDPGDPPAGEHRNPRGRGRKPRSASARRSTTRGLAAHVGGALRRLVTPGALQGPTEPGSASGRGRHPLTYLPGRLVADVLAVTALPLGDPLPLHVLVEADDPPLHPQTHPSRFTAASQVRSLSQAQPTCPHRS